MIFFDTETTGLITNEALPLPQQPRIIELGALRCDEEGRVLSRFTRLLNPGVALPAVITKITGLTDEDLRDAPTFAEVWPELAAFFRGEEEMLAHNARFDQMMLVFELRRLGKEFQFPYCSVVRDTRERWPGKLADWGRAVRGDNYVQMHRAVDDCELLRECWFKSEEPKTE